MSIFLSSWRRGSLGAPALRRAVRNRATQTRGNAKAGPGHGGTKRRIDLADGSADPIKPEPNAL